jgi:multidrug transporter EmrE-like cation transporter
LKGRGDERRDHLAHHFERYPDRDWQVLLKAGMISSSVQAALARGYWAITGLAVAFQPTIWAGLTAYGMSLLLWLAVLARVPVSSAYPFVALSIVQTSVAGAILLDDSFSSAKFVGTMLILAGVVALSRG